MFERSLSSLIKGLRSHRGRDERRYVATIMDEIKHEIRSGDMDVKAEAVLKLTYVSTNTSEYGQPVLTSSSSYKCLDTHPRMLHFICSKSWHRLASISKSLAIWLPHSASMKTPRCSS